MAPISATVGATRVPFLATGSRAGACVPGKYPTQSRRVTTLVHGGSYITDKLGKEALFLRPAIRYDINKWAYAQVGLKTLGFAADWVEFGVGFRPFRW